jgi:hypothetical protein
VSDSYPRFVCHDCGRKYGSKGAVDVIATYHVGDCGCCGATSLPVTSPRSYGHLGTWPIPGVKQLPASERLIQQIMRNFNFERVHQIMLGCQWHWAGAGENQVPDVNQIRSRARDLLKTLTRDPSVNVIATGGLYAEAIDYDPHTKEYQGLGLKFIVEDYDCCFDEL